MLFNLGDDLRIEHPVAVRTSFPGGSAFFSGASAAYAVSEMEHAQLRVQVMLTPLGARRLPGMPLAEAGDRLTDPADLLGPVAAETLDRLQAATAHATPRGGVHAEMSLAGRRIMPGTAGEEKRTRAEAAEATQGAFVYVAGHHAQALAGLRAEPPDGDPRHGAGRRT